MEPLGHIAGTASALQGLITTSGGALIGLAIGQVFDGTTVPLVTGFALCGALALLAALWANPRARAAPAGARRGLDMGTVFRTVDGLDDREGLRPPLEIVLGVRPGHQRLGDLVGMAADRALDPCRRPPDCP